MGWELKRREVKSIFPLNGCLCFDNRMGCFVGSLTAAFTSLLSLIFILLDISEWIDNFMKGSFRISGGFPAFWRQTFWKGFVLCDIAMLIAHPTMLIISIILATSILRPGTCKIYDLHPQVRAWCIIMLMYIITELGVSFYIFSWYGLAAWRRPYLIWLIMFYILRSVANVSFLVVGYSYQCEIYNELKTVPGELEQDYDYMSGATSRKGPSQIFSGSYLSPNDSNQVV